MTILMKILENHGIDFEVIKGRVIVNEYIINKDGKGESQRKDLTEWTRQELAAWLGY